jgi:cytochrome c553
MGVSHFVPGLLGLSRDYLNAQMGAWRSGARRAQAPDCMAAVAQRLAPDEVSAVINWLAAQTVPLDAKPASRLPKSAPMDCGAAPGLRAGAPGLAP